MKSEISRQRIEKYLKAHGVKCTEPALMKLTQKLIDMTPEDAKKILKTVIVRHKGIEEQKHSCADDNNLDFDSQDKKKISVKKNKNIYVVPRGKSGSPFMLRVTKKEYIIDNIFGFTVSGFIVLCIVGGIINALFF